MSSPYHTDDRRPAASKDKARHQLRLPDHYLAYVSDGSALFDDYVEAIGAILPPFDLREA